MLPCASHVVRIDGLCVHTCIYTRIHNLLFYFVLLCSLVIFQTVLKFIVQPGLSYIPNFTKPTNNKFQDVSSGVRSQMQAVWGSVVAPQCCQQCLLLALSGQWSCLTTCGLKVTLQTEQQLLSIVLSSSMPLGVLTVSYLVMSRMELRQKSCALFPSP